jgi:hypothetical protein
VRQKLSSDTKEVDQDLTLLRILTNGLNLALADDQRRISDLTWVIMDYLIRREPLPGQGNNYEINFHFNPVLHRLMSYTMTKNFRDGTFDLEIIKNDFYQAHLEMTLRAVRDYGMYQNQITADGLKIIDVNADYITKMSLGTDQTHFLLGKNQIVGEIRARLGL